MSPGTKTTSISETEETLEDDAFFLSVIMQPTEPDDEEVNDE